MSVFAKLLIENIQILARHREKMALNNAGMTLSIASEPANYYEVKPVEV